MKKILNVTAVVCLYAILLVSCEPPSIRQSAAPHTGNAADADLSQINGISERELSMLFSLTRTEITASDAAKKIADSAGQKKGQFTFTETEALAYDDEKGTFTVKVKGTKGGKSFEKELAFTGFTHPYAGTSLGSLYTLGNVFVFDKAIEKNISLKRFIDDANAAKGIGYTAFSYQLNNGNGKTAETGKHSAYELTAHLTEVQGDKVRIMVYYKTVYKKLSGGNESVEYGPVFTKTAKESESYFTQDDVLKYVFGKTNDNFVKVDTNKFASSYYAMSKFSNSSAVQFDRAQIQKYVDLYRTKDAGEHLAVDIQPGINNPKNGGIEANDFTGELTVDYCIATADQLTAQSGILHSKKITKSGLQKIQTDADIKRHFNFTVILSPLNANSKEKWKDKVLANARLFHVNESGHNPVGVLTNPLTDPGSRDNPYYLTINGNPDDGSSSLGSGNYGLSKDTNDRAVYIQNISLDKTAGSNDLKVSMELCGGRIVEMTTRPFLGHNP